MYRALKVFFGTIIDLFYRRRTVGPGLPESGPLVVVGNHPNGLVDPLIVAHVSQRPVCFLAKEPLFRWPVIGALMRVGKALPIYRTRDGHDTEANRSTFAAVHAALAQGAVICLFPEGTSHSEPSLQPLKTGAARMVLGAESENDWALGVRVVPVGLQYRDKMIFRSDATVVWGEPIQVPDHIRAVHEREPREAVRQLTDHIGEAIRAVTVNLEQWEDLPLLELAGQVWTDENDPTTRLIGLAQGQRSFLATTPERIGALRRRLQDFASNLAELGLEPRDLDGQVRVLPALRFLGAHLLFFVAAWPIILIGTLGYCVPYYAVRALVNIKKPEADVVASVKVLASILFFGAWHLVLVTVGGLWGGWRTALLIGLGLPMAGFLTPGLTEVRQRAWRRVRLSVRLPFAKGRRAALRRERDAIRDQIDALAREYEAAEL